MSREESEPGLRARMAQAKLQAGLKLRGEAHGDGRVCVEARRAAVAALHCPPTSVSSARADDPPRRPASAARDQPVRVGSIYPYGFIAASGSCRPLVVRGCFAGTTPLNVLSFAPLPLAACRGAAAVSYTISMPDSMPAGVVPIASYSSPAPSAATSPAWPRTSGRCSEPDPERPTHIVTETGVGCRFKLPQ